MTPLPSRDIQNSIMKKRLVNVLYRETPSPLIIKESPAKDVEPALAGVFDGAVKDFLAGGFALRVPVLGEEAVHLS